LIEVFSNGTSRFTAGPVDDLMDDVDRSRFVIMEEKYPNEKSLKVFLNGTVALFYRGKVSGYIVKPTNFYYGCVTNKTLPGYMMQKCWNDTIREFYPPPHETASD
jgi:hypothetical protein